MKLNTKEQLFLYDKIDQDRLLYILSKRKSTLDLIEIYNDPHISSIKKEKIVVTIGELVDLKYAVENKDERSVRITLRGRWRRIYTNPIWVFIGALSAIAAILATYHIAIMSNPSPPTQKEIQQTTSSKDSVGRSK